MIPIEKRPAHAAYAREWRERDPGHVRALAKTSRDRHRERVNAKRRAAYRRNSEAARARAARWYRENRERADAANRAWRTAHPKAIRAYQENWAAAVPDRRAAARCATTANRRARDYGADGHIGYETVLELWRREPDCVDCGQGRGLDHVIPFVRGGANTSGNLANRCRSCNARKGRKLPAELAA